MTNGSKVLPPSLTLKRRALSAPLRITILSQTPNLTGLRQTNANSRGAKKPNKNGPQLLLNFYNYKHTRRLGLGSVWRTKSFLYNIGSRDIIKLKWGIRLNNIRYRTILLISQLHDIVLQTELWIALFK